MSKAPLAISDIKPLIDDYLRRHHPDICRHWFHEITVSSVVGGCVSLRVPERVHRQYLQRSCMAAFTEAAQAATGKLVAVKFVGDADEMPTRSPSQLGVTQAPSELDEQLTLSPDYTFDSFVVGPGNRLVHAAAIAVGSNPGRAYNPLFIHGGVGLGKTHVLQSICRVILRQRPQSRIGYVSCQSFSEIFMACVKAGRMQDFRHRFRNLDMLVVDDIHFLSKREQSQEEFFHTFNSLYQAGKQIVLSSDASPNDIPDLEERLVSRFNCGLVARMDRPCYETRVAILKSKAALVGAQIPEEICSYIAARIDTNIRELEGCLTKVRCFALANDRTIDLDLAKEALADDSLGLSSSAQPSIQTIAEAVTRYYDIRLSDLLSKRRHKSISVPRQMCMWLARKHTRYSLEEIGGYFGGRDHTTVLHAVRSIGQRKDLDPDIANAVNRIECVFARPSSR
ncbi:MAG: chromosomal replication initiator protein DnaA [Planctomycetes bacterium]|nr:chromosomal replication initiator protein DnaA [Planctomycetota bacterium]